jgi:hypothetical protein
VTNIPGQKRKFSSFSSRESHIAQGDIVEQRRTDLRDMALHEEEVDQAIHEEKTPGMSTAHKSPQRKKLKMVDDLFWELQPELYHSRL